MKLRFIDGAEVEIDLTNELNAEMFTPIRDAQALRRFRADPELETIVWEGGLRNYRVLRPVGTEG